MYSYFREANNHPKFLKILTTAVMKINVKKNNILT